MASLWDWGKAVIAQINPWDNGANYNSVMGEAKKRREQQTPQVQPRPQPYRQPQQPQPNSNLIPSLGSVGQTPQQRMQQQAQQQAQRQQQQTNLATSSLGSQNSVIKQTNDAFQIPAQQQQQQRNDQIAAQQRQKAVQAAQAQLQQKVRDQNNYYGADAQKLRQEIARGGDTKQIQGLTQSLRNRQGELASGAYKQSQAYDTQQRIEPVVKQGLSYDDIAKRTGTSTQQVQDYMKSYHQGYGDQGVLKNAANMAGGIIGGVVDGVVSTVRKPVTSFQIQEHTKTLQDINREFQSGKITGARAMELADEVAGKMVAKKAVYDDKTGQVRIEGKNPLEFGGEVVQAGVDLAGVLPIGGGVAGGLSKFATGGTKNALQKAGQVLTAGAQTQAESKLASRLVKEGVDEATAKLIGNAITSNAKQAAAYGTAQTGADVMQGRGITPESLALNYGADFLMGAVPEIGLGLPGVHATQVIPHKNLMQNSPEYRAMAETVGATDNVLEKQLLERRMESMRARVNENGSIGGDLSDKILSSKPAQYLFGDKQPVQNATARQNLTKALSQDGVESPVDFGKLTPEQQNITNEILVGAGHQPIIDGSIKVHPSVIAKLVEKRINGDGLTPKDVSAIASNAVHKTDKILDNTNKAASARFAHQKNSGLTHNAFVGQSGGKASLKSVFPIKDNVMVSGDPTSKVARSASSDLEVGANDMDLANSVYDTATKDSIVKNSGDVNRVDLKDNLRKYEANLAKNPPKDLAKRAVSTKNVDIERLKSDPAYQKQVQDSIFASGKPTDNELLKIYRKHVTSDASSHGSNTTRPSTTAPLEQSARQSPKPQPAKKAQTIRGQSKSIQSRQKQSQATRNTDTPAQTGRTSTKSISDTEAKQYVKTMNASQDAARKNVDGSLLDKAIGTRNDFKEKFIDNLAPIEDRMKQAIKNGAQIDAKDNITYQLDRSRRAEGIFNAYISDNGLDKLLYGIKDTKEFDQYLIARHAREIDPEIRTGRNKQMDTALVKKLDGKYKDAAKQLYRYNQNLLDTSVEYGLISKQMAKDLKKQYPEYVPFNRIFNEDELAKLHGNGSGDASISKQTAVQKLKGSNRIIDSPLNSIIDKTRVVVEQGERNRAAKTLADYRSLPGNPFNLVEIPKGETIGARYTISYLDKGAKRTFQTDKVIADAAKNMTREQIGLWGRIAAVPARALRAGATGVNVGFAGANVVKDVVGSAINSRHPMRIAHPKPFVKALAAAFNHKGGYYTELMREGVAGTSFDMYRNPNKMNVGEIQSHKSIRARAKYLATHPEKWYGTIENTIGRSEDFGRALQYYSNKQGFESKYGKGSEKAKLLAADQARNNATNFFRHGSVGKSVNLAIPYWNATMQGTRINYNRLKERPVQTAAKIGMAIAAPSAMIAMNNYGSEEKRKIMDNIPDYEKEGNIIYITDGAKFNEETGRWEGVIKQPLPPQHLGIHNAIQKAVESAKTGKSYDVLDAIGKIGENYTTVDVTNPGETLKKTYVPQGVKVLAEPMTNTNFYSGDKIVPESMKNLDAKDQVSKSTSLTAKKLGELTGKSPIVIDNIIRTATGGAGQNAVAATDWALVQAKLGEDEDIKGKSLIKSITDRFIGAKGTSDGMLYYQSLDKAAADNKLAGKDLSIFNSLVDSKMDSNGDIQGKNERDALNKYQNLAAHPNVAKAISDAAKIRAKGASITGKDNSYDPLYDMSHEKQMDFYNIKAQNSKSAEQLDLINKAGDWYKELGKKRSEYFKNQDIKPAENSQRVKYPEPDKVLQAKMDAYYSMPDGDEKYAYLDANPEISEQFTKVAKYTNAVRKAQGVAELHDYPQADEYVQIQMDAKNWKDPRVAQYLQDMNVYKIVEGASMSRLKGNELDSKTLKAIQSTGKYSIVKNEDGTYSLKYNSSNGYGKGVNRGGGGSSGSGGGRKRSGRGSGGQGTSGNSSTTEDKKLLSTTTEVNKALRKLPNFTEAISAGSLKAPVMKKAPIKRYAVKKRTAKKITAKKA